MSVLVNKETRLVVQGITGNEGTFHTRQAVAYGTNVVAGVTPGKGGQEVDGIPVFNTVSDAVDKTGANVSVISPRIDAATRTLRVKGVLANPDGRSGNHRPQGWVAGAGPRIPAGHPAGGGTILDLAPTALSLLGVDRPADFAGSPLFGLD